MRAGFVLALLTCGGLETSSPGQEPKPRVDPVRDVLQRVKHRAEAQTRDDHRRALLLIQQSHEAFKAGRLDESLKTAQKARELFPGSADIQQAYRNVQAEQRARREHALNVKEATDVLDQALAHVNALVEQERYWQAQQFAEAVRDAALRFPAGSEPRHVTKAIEKFLEDYHAWVASDPPELRMPAKAPVPVGETKPVRNVAELRRALAVPLNVDWRNEKLAAALAFVARETGVPVTVDPALERLRLPANRRLNLRVQHTTAERVLKLITELAGTELLLVEGQVLITTKETALQYTLARGRDPAEAERFLRRTLGLQDRGARPDAAAEPPEVLDVKPAKLPAYLESAEAFTHHLDVLLKPPVGRQQEPD